MGRQELDARRRRIQSDDLLQDETVGVTETQLGGKLSVTDISCVDGTGAAVPADTNLTSGQLEVQVGAPATTEAAPITCTYENTYQPQATLTLVKQVNGGSAHPRDWTLSATSRPRSPDPATQLR